MPKKDQSLLVALPTPFDLIILGVTCAVWVAMMWVQQNWLSPLEEGQAISLMFLPAGVRVLLLLSGRLPAAIGLFVGSSIAVHWVFAGGLGWVDSLAISFLTSFVPYFTIRLTKYCCGVDPQLRNLRFRELFLIATAVSIVSPIAHNVWFCLEGMKPWPDFARNVVSMAAGDMLGTVALFGAIIAMRRAFLRVRGFEG